MVSSISDMFNDSSVSQNMSQILEDPLARKTTLAGKSERIAGLALVQHDFNWELDRVTAGTLIIWGEQDQVSPMRTAKILDFKISQSKLKIIPNAGHTPPVENSVDFNMSVLSFLNSEGTVEAPKKEMARPLRQAPRVVHNIRKFDQIYEGYYDSLFVVRSKRVLIENVQAKYIEILSSGVTIRNSYVHAGPVGVYMSASNVIIENSEIKAQKKAIQARGAELEMTGVYLEADTALATSRSQFDLAGCEFKGWNAAISNDEMNRAHLPVPDVSEFLFSVCKLKSGWTEQYMHGKMEISPANPQ